jgi:hypothetical protein
MRSVEISIYPSLAEGRLFLLLKTLVLVAKRVLPVRKSVSHFVLIRELLRKSVIHGGKFQLCSFRHDKELFEIIMLVLIDNVQIYR